MIDINTKRNFQNMIKRKIEDRQTEVDIEDIESIWSIYKKAITESVYYEACGRKVIKEAIRKGLLGGMT